MNPFHGSLGRGSLTGCNADSSGGTPYEGGYFRVSFNFGPEYPNVPPKCMPPTIHQLTRTRVVFHMKLTNRHHDHENVPSQHFEVGGNLRGHTQKRLEEGVRSGTCFSREHLRPNTDDVPYREGCRSPHPSKHWALMTWSFHELRLMYRRSNVC